eukprot:96785_1
MPPRGGGLDTVEYNQQHQTLTVGLCSPNNYTTFEISSFHVSCKSDKFTGENMTGIVLYEYDDKRDWYLNGIHCKTGYIILRLSKNISHIKDEPGAVHGACYKSVFNESLDKNKVVGGGFAYLNGKWKFNSWTFNTGSKYHNNEKEMNPLEQRCIEVAIVNWKKGLQNTYVKDIGLGQADTTCVLL